MVRNPFNIDVDSLPDPLQEQAVEKFWAKYLPSAESDHSLFFCLSSRIRFLNSHSIKKKTVKSAQMERDSLSAVSSSKPKISELVTEKQYHPSRLIN
jgi:hypothetical protein